MTIEPEKDAMDQAFMYACGYGRVDVVKFLFDSGVYPGLRLADGRTGLHSAAYGGQVEVIRLLIQHGTPVDARDASYHATALDVALWVWNNSSDSARRERCYEVIALLARAGARFDPQQWYDPESNELGMLERIAGDPRMQGALRGDEAPG
jgi:ankyrin repeat protein